jgi:hypothetical protein
MAAKSDSKGSGIFLDPDPEAFEEEFCTRMIASAMGMARLCGRKKCRRRKRCFGPYDDGLPCLTQHKGLAKARFEGALKRLGWPRRDGDSSEP